MNYDFAERLEFSLGGNIMQDKQIISKILSGCVKVEKTNTTTDKSGIDYIAHLFGGGRINIDVKTRDRGASMSGTTIYERMAQIYSISYQFSVRFLWKLQRMSSTIISTRYYQTRPQVFQLHGTCALP